MPEDLRRIIPFRPVSVRPRVIPTPQTRALPLNRSMNSALVLLDTPTKSRRVGILPIRPLAAVHPLFRRAGPVQTFLLSSQPLCRKRTQTAWSFLLVPRVIRPKNLAESPSEGWAGDVRPALWQKNPLVMFRRSRPIRRRSPIPMTHLSITPLGKKVSGTTIRSSRRETARTRAA